MAIAARSLPLGQNLEQQFRAAAVEFHVAKLVQTQEINSAVAGDGLGQLLVVGSAAWVKAGHPLCLIAESGFAPPSRPATGSATGLSEQVVVGGRRRQRPIVTREVGEAAFGEADDLLPSSCRLDR